MPTQAATRAKSVARIDLLQRLARAQAERAEQSLTRILRNVDELDGVRICIQDRWLVNFASNDYLGLARHPAVSDALMAGARRWGVGATAAHLLGGHRREHAQLEEKVAAWTGRERAVLFSTGYMANLGAMQALLGDGDVCVQDKLNHASLIDAARLSGAELRRYAHADVDAARRQLESSPAGAALVASDGVFSMDGTVAPLGGLATLCTKQHATLMVDDAHGIGVLGADGSGSVRAAGLGQDEVPLLVATFGKALGVGGAFVAGSESLIDGIVQFARTFLFTTAMPPAIAAACSAAVDIASNERWRRNKLTQLIRHFRAGASERGIPLLDSATAIQPIVVGSSQASLAASASLEASGFFVPAIRTPSVAQSKARLRITLSSAHEEAQVEALLDALARAVALARMEH